VVAENRILRSQLPSKLRLSNSERRTLAEIGKRLGRKLLSDVACVAKPETILGWYRRLIARKFDGSKHRSYPGRQRISPEVEALILRMAQENSTWGYDLIAGALANLGHHVSDQTVGNVLRRHGIPTAPKRSQTSTWKNFISAHMAVFAGTELLHGRGADLAWTRHLLRPFLPPSGDPAHHACRHHTRPNGTLGRSDGAKCCR
jgi:putative transposase